jgi:hypothetical protein
VVGDTGPDQEGVMRSWSYTAGRVSAIRVKRLDDAGVPTGESTVLSGVLGVEMWGWAPLNHRPAPATDDGKCPWCHRTGDHNGNCPLRNG